MSEAIVVVLMLVYCVFLVPFNSVIHFTALNSYIWLQVIYVEDTAWYAVVYGSRRDMVSDQGKGTSMKYRALSVMYHTNFTMSPGYKFATQFVLNFKTHTVCMKYTAPVLHNMQLDPELE